MDINFYTNEESQINQSFLDKKYLVAPAENIEILDKIRYKIAEAACQYLKESLPPPSDVGLFLNTIHQKISLENLNEFRLKIISEMNQTPWFRQAYYTVSRRMLALLVGNELAMQKRINLSIQLPDDTSSLLPVHADVWAGDSPYEIVVWIPLVDCFATKSMFIADSEIDTHVQANFKQFKHKSTEDLYQTIKDNIEFLNVPYGSILLFSQNVMHGNRINEENETRWSMNCRFKNVLTPYAGKKLGDFFEPITIRPVTRLGLNYKLPESFYE